MELQITIVADTGSGSLEQVVNEAQDVGEEKQKSAGYRKRYVPNVVLRGDPVPLLRTVNLRALMRFNVGRVASMRNVNAMAAVVMSRAKIAWVEGCAPVRLGAMPLLRPSNHAIYGVPIERACCRTVRVYCRCEYLPCSLGGGALGDIS